MCNNAVNVKGIQPYVRTNILNYEKDFLSPIFVIDKSHCSSSMFVSLRKICITLHVPKRNLYFHFTMNVSKLFNVVIYREFDPM